jgi:hypothetical protein
MEINENKCVNALSGLYLIVTRAITFSLVGERRYKVSMPSRAYTSLLPGVNALTG